MRWPRRSLNFCDPLPQLAYLVLLIIWLGIGETSKITMLFLAALPVSAIAARDGVANIPPERLRVARALGASKWQVFCHVIFPSALPEILVGARLAAGIVYGTLIASEIIAGSSGIGWMIMDAGRFLRSDYVFAGIGMIGLGGDCDRSVTSAVGTTGRALGRTLNCCLHKGKHHVERTDYPASCLGRCWGGCPGVWCPGCGACHGEYRFLH